jgi:hypothetical protein
MGVFTYDHGPLPYQVELPGGQKSVGRPHSNLHQRTVALLQLCMVPRHTTSRL